MRLAFSLRQSTFCLIAVADGLPDEELKRAAWEAAITLIVLIAAMVSILRIQWSDIGGGVVLFALAVLVWSPRFLRKCRERPASTQVTEPVSQEPLNAADLKTATMGQTDIGQADWAVGKGKRMKRS
ncbi:MAG: hypothetical protein GY822_28935 [Deltaproteobacteria bacterium]|nr:hypothetical protein [Deltaproteobacteria bacterium]